MGWVSRNQLLVCSPRYPFNAEHQAGNYEQYINLESFGLTQQRSRILHDY